MFIFAPGIEVWCNGSTTDFGSVCPGSNPGTSTEKRSRQGFSFLLRYRQRRAAGSTYNHPAPSRGQGEGSPYAATQLTPLSPAVLNLPAYSERKCNKSGLKVQRMDPWAQKGRQKLTEGPNDGPSGKYRRQNQTEGPENGPSAQRGSSILCRDASSRSG